MDSDDVDYGEVLEGIMRHLRSQAEALNHYRMLEDVAFRWARMVNGEAVHVDGRADKRCREPVGLFLDLAASGDYRKEGPLTRYEIREVAPDARYKPVTLSSGKTLPRFGLYRRDTLLICTYVGSVNLVEAHSDALRAQAGDFPHIEAIPPFEDD